MTMSTSLLDFFSSIENPRFDRKCVTLFTGLLDILFLTICSVLSGCNVWD